MFTFSIHQVVYKAFSVLISSYLTLMHVTLIPDFFNSDIFGGTVLSLC